MTLKQQLSWQKYQLFYVIPLGIYSISFFCYLTYFSMRGIIPYHVIGLYLFFCPLSSNISLLKLQKKKKKKIWHVLYNYKVTDSVYLLCSQCCAYAMPIECSVQVQLLLLNMSTSSLTCIHCRFCLEYFFLCIFFWLYSSGIHYFHSSSPFLISNSSLL